MSSTANMLSELKAWARGAAVYAAQVTTGSGGAVGTFKGVALKSVAFASGVYTLTFAGPVAEVISVVPQVWAKSDTTATALDLQVGDVTFPGKGEVVVTLLARDGAGAAAAGGIPDAAFSVEIFCHRSGANRKS